MKVSWKVMAGAGTPTRTLIVTDAASTAIPAAHPPRWAPSRPVRTLFSRSYFFPSGFQFISSVIGAVALSSSVLMRKRPSGWRPVASVNGERHLSAVAARRQGTQDLNPAGAMMAAPITVTGTTLSPGAPMVLFPTRIVGGGEDTAQARQDHVAPERTLDVTTHADDWVIRRND